MQRRHVPTACRVTDYERAIRFYNMEEGGESILLMCNFAQLQNYVCGYYYVSSIYDYEHPWLKQLKQHILVFKAIFWSISKISTQ